MEDQELVGRQGAGGGQGRQECGPYQCFSLSGHGRKNFTAFPFQANVIVLQMLSKPWVMHSCATSQWKLGGT